MNYEVLQRSYSIQCTSVVQTILADGTDYSRGTVVIASIPLSACGLSLY